MQFLNPAILVSEMVFNTAYADLNKLIKNVMPRGTMLAKTAGLHMAKTVAVKKIAEWAASEVKENLSIFFSLIIHRV